MDFQILGAMRAIAAFDGLIGLHAENHEIMHGRMNALVAAGRTDARAHAEASPEIGEIEAISRAITFARETGVRCHIVHLSTARAAALIETAGGNLKAAILMGRGAPAMSEAEAILESCGGDVRASLALIAARQGEKAG